MTSASLAHIESLAAGGAETSAVGRLFASPLLWAVLLFALGVWLSLPRGRSGGRIVGHVLSVVSLGVFAWQLPPLVGWLDQSLFASLAAVTVLSCLAAISAKNPVYSAIWFGLALLGTAGLFLLTGAQFLSVATVTVYAGAILVTFLFVIMLAQPRGHAYYDRVSWEAFLSAAAGAILVGLLSGAIDRSIAPATERTASAAHAPAVRDDAALHGILAENHVAHLGQELLGRHLVSMQAAGALMLAALVGAVAIVAHSRQSGLASLELAGGQTIGTRDEATVVLPPGREERSPTTPTKTPGGIHA
jgi:NADH-quinone oxidoreductase subunit J